MKKSKVLILLVFLLFLCLCNTNTGNPTYTYTLVGIVYYNLQPIEGVRVEAQYLGGETHEGHNWYPFGDKTTGTDGKYEFVLEKTESRGWRFQARARHPDTGVWSEWKQSGSVPAGGSTTVNFAFE